MKIKLLCLIMMLLTWSGLSNTNLQVSNNIVQIGELIKKMENNKNSSSSGWNSKQQKWYPHISYELGEKTVAYGHKIKKGERFNDGLSDVAAHNLLYTDIIAARNEVYRQIKSKYNHTSLLTYEQEAMLIEFVFNLGSLSKFPVFTKSVLANDWATAKKHYKRYAGKRELKRRNVMFFNTFLKYK